MKLKMNRPVFPGLLVFVFVLSSLTAGVGQAAAADAVSRTVAKGSVDQVLGGLKKMVADHGMMVMGELHQGKVLEMTGLKVESESIFVGNPSLGKQLFEIEPGAGTVLPVRVNIYKNAEGKTVVAYIPPSRQLAGFDNPMLDKAAAMLDETLAGMVGMIGN
ncbi:MAG: DUF302 domain-containing protein [Candidatus Krumholzibacteriia bacterium]